MKVPATVVDFSKAAGLPANREVEVFDLAQDDYDLMDIGHPGCKVAAVVFFEEQATARARERIEELLCRVASPEVNEKQATAEACLQADQGPLSFCVRARVRCGGAGRG